MACFRCIACGYVYNEKNEEIEFNNLPDDWHCPLCKRKKVQFELADEFEEKEILEVINSTKTPYNAVIINKDNPAIERVEGCINCGICTKTCLEREKMGDLKYLNCVGCGQCILTCPKKVLQPKNSIYKFLEAKKNKKLCIAYIAPASRVSIGDKFGYQPGALLGTKLVGLLKKLGFKYVFDVTFGADLTIMEEATELIDRIRNKKVLPMMSSCCPAWVRYAQIFYPELVPHLSTAKSPIAIEGSVIRNYFTKVKNINPNDIFTVAITPCTAKKWEIIDPELNDTNAVITINELTDYLNHTQIDFTKIKRRQFDKVVGIGSGAGLIFGSSGGVLEATIRTAYYLITNNHLKKLDILKVRGYNGIKEATIKINDITLNVAAVDEMANAKSLLESIKNNTCKYDFVEIMNCRGGCVGGGGQPYHQINEEKIIKEKRMNSLYQKDAKMKIRTAYSNPYVKRFYKTFLDYPFSEKSKELLHRSYNTITKK